MYVATIYKGWPKDIWEEGGERQQINDIYTFNPILAKYPSKEELKLALSSLIYLKQKRNVDIKGISCVDGQPQRQKINK